MRYVVEYFNERVRDTVESWPVGLLADYLRLVSLVSEYGLQVRMPHTRALGAGLFELRPHGSDCAGRALFCYASADRIVIVHAFIKKTQATPRRDIGTARRRMRQVLR